MPFYWLYARLLSINIYINLDIRPRLILIFLGHQLYIYYDMVEKK